MNVTINITLDQEDIDNGVTAEAAVERVFPGRNYHVGVESNPKDHDEYAAEPAMPEMPSVPGDEGEGAAEPDEYTEEAAAPAAPVADILKKHGIALDAELDSAGVPWCAEIHSSNKSKYQKGSKEPEGRWQWKRGSDKTEREQLAQDLATAIATANAAPAAPAATAPPAANMISTGEDAEETVAPPAAAPSAAPAPPAAPPAGPPAAAAPPAAAPPAAAPPAAEAGTAEGKVTWPHFVVQLKANGYTHADVTPLLAPYNIEKVVQLSTPENSQALQEIAAQLGIYAQ